MIAGALLLVCVCLCSSKDLSSGAFLAWQPMLELGSHHRPVQGQRTPLTTTSDTPGQCAKNIIYSAKTSQGGPAPRLH